MSRLVKDGKINLDGTLPKYQKEKMVCEQFEVVEDIIEQHELKGGVKDIEKIVALYAEIYDACNKGGWVTIRNNDFIYCEPKPQTGYKEFRWKRITNKELEDYENKKCKR